MNADSYRVVRLKNGYLVVAGVKLDAGGEVTAINLDDLADGCVHFEGYEYAELVTQFDKLRAAFEAAPIDEGSAPSVLFSEVADG